MDDHLSRLLERGLGQLARGVARHAQSVRLLGLAALGPPVRFGTKAEIELLLVADPLPDRQHRSPWIETAGGLRLRLRWKSLPAFLYPSPLYLQILKRGAILYDPHGLLQESFRVLLDGLTTREPHRGRAGPSMSWSGVGGWPDGPLTPARPFPRAAGRGGRALAL